MGSQFVVGIFVFFLEWLLPGLVITQNQQSDDREE